MAVNLAFIEEDKKPKQSDVKHRANLLTKC